MKASAAVAVVAHCIVAGVLATSGVSKTALAQSAVSHSGAESRAVLANALAAQVVAAPAVAASEAGQKTILTAVDDSGRTVVLAGPARRIVTLAPSLTELVFAAGGGAAIVGTTVLSDYPAAARSIARVGEASRLDVERIIALGPDLVLVWQRGALSRDLEQLAAAGIMLYRLEPRRLDDVAEAIVRLGALLGTERIAQDQAAALRARLARLRHRYAGATPVRVFYQVWQRPLMTINGSHLVSDVIDLCGGRNVFASLAPLVPTLSDESVVGADPEAILSADETGSSAVTWRRDPGNSNFAAWRRHADLKAVRRGWLYTLDGDAISRPGPRIVDGAEAVCTLLDEVRRERQRR